MYNIMCFRLNCMTFCFLCSIYKYFNRGANKLLRLIIYFIKKNFILQINHFCKANLLLIIVVPIGFISVSSIIELLEWWMSRMDVSGKNVSISHWLKISCNNYQFKKHFQFTLIQKLTEIINQHQSIIGQLPKLGDLSEWYWKSIWE